MSVILRPILGDQLSDHLASLRASEPGDVIVMAEMISETSYVHHHRQKIVMIFAAMRHFAKHLQAQGHTLLYYRFDDNPPKDLIDVLDRACQQTGASQIIMTEPGEYRLSAQLAGWDRPIALSVIEDDRFLCSHQDFAKWAKDRKQLRMEFFYRDMRRQTGLLMDGDAPVGGQWNFDRENRKPPKTGLAVPPAPAFATSAILDEVVALVDARFESHFGDLAPFHWPVTHDDAQQLLDFFLHHKLPHFGDYQDAMVTGEALMYHSQLAAAMNIGLLEPLAVCRAAEAQYHNGHAPLNAVEGFIRQIIGWREFIRGVYWQFMPEYADRNFFNADNPLPDFFYSAKTDLNCLAQTITATKQFAYAHHIQRLMITGNFALLAGIAPAAINQWYLEVYADAFEWVQLPNTSGMAIFADGGLVGSKPYAASGAYINRMSDYCRDCRYHVKEATGDDACPFNFLYWDFIDRHEKELSGNPRMSMIYRNLARMDPQKRQAIRDQAGDFKSQLALEKPQITPILKA